MGFRRNKSLIHLKRELAHPPKKSTDLSFQQATVGPTKGSNADCESMFFLTEFCNVAKMIIIHKKI
jgi:hypothetical protein